MEDRYLFKAKRFDNEEWVTTTKIITVLAVDLLAMNRKFITILRMVCHLLVTVVVVVEK